MDGKRIAIIGAGIMGRSILRALMERGVPAERLSATTRRRETAESVAAETGVAVSTDNPAAARGAEVIILAVKPMSITEVVSDLVAAGSLGEGALLVSIAAGVRLESIERAAGDSTRVVRAMPNLPCAIGSGMTVLSRGKHAADGDVDVARTIFEPMGLVRELDEKQMDTVTGLAASGPAFFYVMIEALADGAVARGLPRDAAIEIAAQIAHGAGRMVLETGKHPAALKDEVTTPAGCTIAGILALEDGRIRSTLSRAVEIASIRAGELGSKD